jgi:hypothetical protein
MAKPSKKQQEARSRADQLSILKWTANGRDREEGINLGIMVDQFAPVTAEQRKAAAAEALQMELEPAQQEVLRLWKDDKRTAKDLGFALLAVQKQMTKRGAFTAWWTSEGLEKNRVYYCMRIVQKKDGDKPKGGEERPRRSSRAVAFSEVNDILRDLWKLKESEEYTKKEAEELLDRIVAEIKERFMLKARGANA